MKLFILTGLFSLFLVLPSAMAADVTVPALDNAPNSLNDDQRVNFVLQRQKLQTQLDELTKAAADFGAETADQQTDDQYNKVNKMTQDYTSAANAYNGALEAAVCAQLVQLQSQFQSLNDVISSDRKVVQNFGFNKTVDEIEYWGKLPDRQVEEARDEFKSVLFDVALASTSEAASVVGSLTPDQVDALNNLAHSQGLPPMVNAAGAHDVHIALELLDKSRLTYKTADDVKKGQMLNAACRLAALASNSHAFGILVTADGWAAYQVYQSATAVETVNQLTKANEGDLILLKVRSDKLKKEVDQLTIVKKQMVELSPLCDSTKLAH